MLTYIKMVLLHGAFPSRWHAAVAALVIFVLGVIVGALIERPAPASPSALYGGTR